jgi:hypothetical protein
MPKRVVLSQYAPGIREVDENFDEVKRKDAFID